MPIFAVRFGEGGDCAMSEPLLSPSSDVLPAAAGPVRRTQLSRHALALVAADLSQAGGHVDIDSRPDSHGGME